MKRCPKCLGFKAELVEDPHHGHAMAGAKCDECDGTGRVRHEEANAVCSVETVYEFAQRLGIEEEMCGALNEHVGELSAAIAERDELLRDARRFVATSSIGDFPAPNEDGNHAREQKANVLARIDAAIGESKDKCPECGSVRLHGSCSKCGRFRDGTYGCTP